MAPIRLFSAEVFISGFVCHSTPISQHELILYLLDIELSWKLKYQQIIAHSLNDTLIKEGMKGEDEGGT
jgi:hypothetical protein